MLPGAAGLAGARGHSVPLYCYQAKGAQPRHLYPTGPPGPHHLWGGPSSGLLLPSQLASLVRSFEVGGEASCVRVRHLAIMWLIYRVRLSLIENWLRWCGGC